MIDDELDDFLKRFPPGIGILSHPRWPKPFIIKSPLITLPRVTDEEIDRYMGDFWRKYPLIPAVRVQEKTKESVTEAHKQYLMEVVNHPYECSTVYNKTLNWSASTGNRVKAQVESMQLIRLHKIQLDRRGGIPEAIEILPAGYEKIGLEPKRLPGKGGFLHAFWIGHIAKKIADKKPVIEKVLNSKAADLGVETAIGWMAYEVQLDCKESLIKDLISKDLVGFQHVTICVQSNENSLRVKGIVAGMKVENKVEVRLLSEFY